MPRAVRFDAVSTCSTGPNQSIQVKNAPVGRATSCVQNVSTPSGPSALASTRLPPNKVRRRDFQRVALFIELLE